MGITAIVITACSSGNQELGLYSNFGGADLLYDVDIEEQSDVERTKPVDVVESIDLSAKKIIKNGTLSLEVNNLETAKKRVDSLVQKMNGYYGSETYRNRSNRTDYLLQIRVPAVHFEQLVITLEAGEGKVTEKNLKALDVTEQYTDIEIRLTNKRNYLNRYQELVRQAKTVKEVLDIEERIRGLEEEIESVQGRLRYLSDQISYSTLSLTLSMPTDYKFEVNPQAKFVERFKRSIVSGWQGFVGFILALLYLWPLWIIMVIALSLLVYRRRRKRKGKKMWITQ